MTWERNFRFKPKSEIHNFKTNDIVTISQYHLGVSTFNKLNIYYRLLTQEREQRNPGFQMRDIPHNSSFFFSKFPQLIFISAKTNN